MTEESGVAEKDVLLAPTTTPLLLGRKTAAGSIMLVGARLISRMFDLITMLILARLLGPSDFGLVAIAASVVGVLDAILELPLNQALLRLDEITEAQYDTAFTIGLLRGAVLTAALIAAALPISWGYHDPRLILLICVLSVAPGLRSMVSPKLARFQKQMNFWRDLAIEFIGKIAGFALSVATALLTHSYWALVVGSVSFPLVMVGASYIFAPYRPRLTLSEIRVFAGFLGWISAGQVVNALNWQCERLLLGSMRSVSQLGLFSTASDITSIPFLAMFGPISRPLLAAFAHLRDDPERLARSYQSAAIAVIALGLPIIVGISLEADPLVRVILGSKFLGAVFLVHWLALSLIPALFAVPVWSLIMAFGETNLFFRRNLLEFGLKFPIALIGIWKFGFAGLIAGRLVSEIGIDFFSILTVRRLTGISVLAQLLGPWRSMVSAALMVPAVLWCNQQFVAEGTILHSIFHLVVASGLGAIVYFGASWVLWNAAGRPPGPEATAGAIVQRTVGRVRSRKSKSPITKTEEFS